MTLYPNYILKIISSALFLYVYKDKYLFYVKNKGLVNNCHIKSVCFVYLWCD